jgi:hypothetical protein
MNYKGPFTIPANAPVNPNQGFNNGQSNFNNYRPQPNSTGVASRSSTFNPNRNNPYPNPSNQNPYNPPYQNRPFNPNLAKPPIDPNSYRLKKLQEMNQTHLDNHKLAEAEMIRAEREENEMENHYNLMLVSGIVGISLYYIGACLMIFFQNVDGQAVVTLEANELSWQLFFSDFFGFLRNFFTNIFGYFIQYGKLFGYFPDYGNLNVEPNPKYLMPVDIIIKAATIIYFHFFWMKFDTQKVLNNGYINSKYPYLTKRKREVKKVEATAEKIEDPFSLHEPPKKVEESGGANINPAAVDFDEEEEEEEEDDPILPFSGVHKPIEEFYHKNEAKIYGIIRTRILPGSNLILALYFSARYVLSFTNPLGIILYILGIMSMFWCMQTFLVILDHNQYPPDEETAE